MHGRGENLTELAFIAGNKPTPDLDPGDGFFVRLYGRFCNASKFAGETDLFEAMEAARHFLSSRSTANRRVRILDGRRIDVAHCGTSRGPVGRRVARRGLRGDGDLSKCLCKRRAAAVVRASALAFLRRDRLRREPREYAPPCLLRRDRPAKSVRRFNGKNDGERGIELERFVGPNTAHKYEPNTKKELEKRLQEITAKGREPAPAKCI